jgi:hypothetical protein
MSNHSSHVIILAELYPEGRNLYYEGDHEPEFIEYAKTNGIALREHGTDDTETIYHGEIDSCLQFFCPADQLEKLYQGPFSCEFGS